MYKKVTSNKTGKKLLRDLRWVWIANKKGVGMVEPENFNLRQSGFCLTFGWVNRLFEKVASGVENVITCCSKEDM